MPNQKEKVPFDPRNAGGRLGDGSQPKKQTNWMVWDCGGGRCGYCYHCYCGRVKGSPRHLSSLTTTN